MPSRKNRRKVKRSSDRNGTTTKRRSRNVLNGCSSSKKSKPWDDGDSDHDESPKLDFYSDSDESDLDSVELSPKTRKTGMITEKDDDSLSEELNEEADDYQIIGPECHSCPWVDVDKNSLSTLKLPPSSSDLLLQNDAIFGALEVYEICRTFSIWLKLSPFLFENLCASLNSPEQSKLLAEIHICLLKFLLKDDEDEQTVLTPIDMNNSSNIVIHLLEPMTYAEVLRQYADSDRTRVPPTVLSALSDQLYPFSPVETRLIVLHWLCDRFLDSAEFRRIIRSEGRIEHDEHCRDCGKQGKLVLCDGCEAAYHLDCTDLPQVPEGQWWCAICQLHKASEVTDSNSPFDRSQQPIRRDPLGFDRHGRRYWFLARRIFIHDEQSGQVHYYSSAPQLRRLVSLLDLEVLEFELCSILLSILPTVVNQMSITMRLGVEQAGNRWTALGLDNRPLGVFWDGQDGQAGSRLINEQKVAYNSNDDAKLLEIDSTNCPLLAKLDDILTEDLVSNFWIGNNNADILNDDQEGYRLGETPEKSYGNYVNQYSSSDYAKTPYARAKERDRHKYMSLKFSLMDEGEFQWSASDLFGSEKRVLSILSQALLNMARKIPRELFHRRWSLERQPNFHRLLSSSAIDFATLRQQLLLFEANLRRTVLSSVWSDTLGHTKLVRLTAEDREWRQKLEMHRKHEEKRLVLTDPDEEDGRVVWVKYTKVDGPPKHQLWKMKDEQYRMNGRGALGGWIWMASGHTFRRIDPRNVRTAARVKATAAARRLERLLRGITAERLERRKRALNVRRRNALLSCFSPNCRHNLAYSPIAGPESGFQRCYSATCRRAQVQAEQMLTDETANVVPSTGSISRLVNQTGQLGVDRPYPLAVPFKFVSRTGRRTILLLPPAILKRMSRQGGMGKTMPVGFSGHSKSNLTMWPYPCSRPLFEIAWRYLTQNACGLHALALQLRILYACIRWADIEMDISVVNKPTREVVHFDDRDEIRNLIGHLELPPNGLTCRYKLRLEIFPLDDEDDTMNDDDEFNDPYYSNSGCRTPRGSSRPRKLRQSLGSKTDKQQLQMQRPTRKKIVEKSMNGVDLKLVEIQRYWKKYDREKMRMRMVAGRGQPMRSGGIPAPSLSRGIPSSISGIAFRTSNSETVFKRVVDNSGMTSGGMLGVRKVMIAADGTRRVVIDRKSWIPPDDSQHVKDSYKAPSILQKKSCAYTMASVKKEMVEHIQQQQQQKQQQQKQPLLMIRKPDGTTQYLRPMHSDNPHQLYMLVPNADIESAIPPVGSLADHANMAQSIYPAVARRGRPILAKQVYNGRGNRIHIVNANTGRGIRVHTGGSASRQPINVRIPPPPPSAFLPPPLSPSHPKIHHDPGHFDDDFARLDDRNDEGPHHLDYSTRPPGRPRTAYLSNMLPAIRGRPRGRPRASSIQERLSRRFNRTNRTALVGEVDTYSNDSSDSLCNNNGDEDEARIAEAIDREELLLLARRNRTVVASDPQAYNNNNNNNNNDDDDDVVCKQVLESLVSLVCKYDRINGWSKRLTLKSTRNRKTYDREYRARKAAKKELQQNLDQAFEMLKNEVRKRRFALEMEARSAELMEKNELLQLTLGHFRFYVGCDLCFRWFHGKCVSISEHKAKRIVNWACSECRKERAQTEDELYCVCRTSYNDQQFYVGCDGCEGWFHPACVGISKTEAESLSEYQCPQCRMTSIPRVSSPHYRDSPFVPVDYAILWRLLESLTEHRTSWPFREPVDSGKFPDYRRIVKRPMDLSQVQKKLSNLDYNRLQEFIGDIGLIFDNAHLFNPLDSPIYQCADILEKRFRENLGIIKEEMANQGRSCGDRSDKDE